MKKNCFLATVLTVSMSFLSQAQNLIITGVFDGSLSRGNPKGVELYVINTIPNLSIYGLGSANNGEGSDGQEFQFPEVAAQAGSFIYVSNEVDNFKTFFGFEPNYTDGSMIINGNDAVELFMNETVIDVFGDINVDGKATTWEYLDGWAYRKSGRTASTTFSETDFTYSGVNGLEGGTNNATANFPMPIGTYFTINSTEPTLTITSPTSGEKEATTTINVDILVDNFTFSADNGSGLGDNSGDGFIRSSFTVSGGVTESSPFFSDALPDLIVSEGNSYTLTLELVDNSGSSFDPAIIETVSFSVKFPCEIQFTNIATACDVSTDDTDTYSTTINFKGSTTNIGYTITAKDSSGTDVGIVGGDDPNNVESGVISITDVPEGVDYTVTIVGGQGSSCNFIRNIASPRCLPSLSCPSTGSIIITEIMQNPDKVSDNLGEYFEVYNTTDVDIDLKGWLIKVVSSENPNITSITSSVVVPAKGYAVLGKNADTTTNGGVTVDYQYDSSLFLTNAIATITIECNASVFDSVTYDNGATFPDPNGKSMELSTNKYSYIDNDDGINWAEATSKIDESSEDSDLGTPGTINDFVLSVSNSSILGFATYPNPVMNQRFTLSSSSADAKEISIFNVIGKKVFTIIFFDAKKVIDVSTINPGVYILKVTENGKTATKKLVIR